MDSHSIGAHAVSSISHWKTEVTASAIPEAALVKSPILNNHRATQEISSHSSVLFSFLGFNTSRFLSGLHVHVCRPIIVCCCSLQVNCCRRHNPWRQNTQLLERVTKYRSAGYSIFATRPDPRLRGAYEYTRTG